MIRVTFIHTGKAGGRLTGVDTSTEVSIYLFQIALLILGLVAVKA